MPKERLVSEKELGIYGFENSQPLQTAKDTKIKTWLLSKDQVEGATGKTSSKTELRVQL